MDHLATITVTRTTTVSALKLATACLGFALAINFAAALLPASGYGQTDSGAKNEQISFSDSAVATDYATSSYAVTDNAATAPTVAEPIIVPNPGEQTSPPSTAEQSTVAPPNPAPSSAAPSTPDTPIETIPPTTALAPAPAESITTGQLINAIGERLIDYATNDFSEEEDWPPATEPPAKPSEELSDNERAVAGINEQIQRLDDLISKLEEINLTADINKLEKIKTKLSAYQPKIETAKSDLELGLIMHSYGHEYSQADRDIENISVKIELPPKLSEFAETLAQLKSSDNSAWSKSGLEKFYQRLIKKNQAITQMSPRHQAERGVLDISKFVSANRDYFQQIIKGNNLWPEDDELWRRAQSGALELNFSIPHPPTPLIFEKKKSAPAKALLIIVDDWLEDEPQFKKQNRIKLGEVMPLAQKVLNNVKKVYQEMSYGKFNWEFDTCEIESDKIITPPRPYSIEAMFRTAIGLCEIKNKIEIKKYKTVIVFPGGPDHQKFYYGRMSYGYATLASGNTAAGSNYEVCGVSIGPDNEAFYSLALSHELGHCLGLPHANSYTCGNRVYDKSCALGGPRDGHFIEYGDLYDAMGLESLYQRMFPPPAFSPDFNCVYKEALDWLEATPAKAGTYLISSFEQAKNFAPKCYALEIDQELVDQKKFPCDTLYLEYRAPRQDRTGAARGGLALHCKNGDLLVGKYSPPITLPFQSEVLDCSPTFQPLTSLSDIWDSPNKAVRTLIKPGQVCHTGLGYDIGFENQALGKGLDGTLGEVKITPSIFCRDKDLDGYQNPNDEKGCALKGKADCDDKNDKIHPGAKEICDGLDNDCSGKVDNDEIGDVCKTCKDTDDVGRSIFDPLVYGFEPLVKGEVTLQRNGVPLLGNGDGADVCGDLFGGYKSTSLIEYYCKVEGPDRARYSAPIDCKEKFGMICKNGACVEPPPCADWDKDGLQNPKNPPNCKLTTKPDCDDNNNSIGECPNNCADVDHDGYQIPNVPPGCAYNGKLDCDDKNANIHPNQPEVCDGLDNNCNGITDEGCITCTDTDKGLRGDLGGGLNPFMSGRGIIKGVTLDGKNLNVRFSDSCFNAEFLNEITCAPDKNGQLFPKANLINCNPYLCVDFDGTAPGDFGAFHLSPDIGIDRDNEFPAFCG